jgi:type VI protein secretion system component VasF
MGTALEFEPGEVTPEQLVQYRQAYEAAQKREAAAGDRYFAAYFAYCAALDERKKAEFIYVWAKQGMVEVIHE